MKSSFLFKLEKFLYDLLKDYKPNSFQYFKKLRETKSLETQFKIITKYLQFEPNDAQAYYFRGMAYFDMNLHKEAVSDFTRCLELDDEMLHVYNCRGLSFYFLKEYEKSLGDLHQTNKADVCNIFIYRAEIYKILDEKEKAIENYLLAINIEPFNHSLYYELAYLYYVTKQYGHAIEQLNDLIHHHALLDLAYDLRGCSYYESHQYEEARNDFNWCIMNDSEDGRNYYNRGITFFHTAHYELCLNDLKRSLELGHTNNPNVYIYLGRTELAMNHANAALDWLNKAEQLFEQNAKIYYFRSHVYKFMKDEKNYKLDLHKARNINPNIESEAYE